MLLRFYAEHGRFPRGRAELPDETVAYLARQVGVPATELAFYEWSGRTVEYRRAQIRKFFGFRECTVADADKLGSWLAEEVCHRERRPERVRERLLGHCREEGIEPPALGRLGRIIGSMILSLYARGLSTRDIEAHLCREVARAIANATFGPIRGDDGGSDSICIHAWPRA